MPPLLYRCKFCGSMHEVPGRPDGTVYLRCVATREWAWYDAATFQSPAGPPRPRRRSAGAQAQAAARPSARRNRRIAAPARGAARRGAASRKASGRAGRRKRRS